MVQVLRGTVPRVLVTDLRHFLDLSEDAPGPTRRLAEHLSNIVRAATVGDVGTAWKSALPCRRRPAHRRCQGRMIVLLQEFGTPVRWQCSVCGDEGVISNWEDSPFDLRRRRLTVVGAVSEIVIPTRWPQPCVSCTCSIPTVNDWFSASAFARTDASFSPALTAPSTH